MFTLIAAILVHKGKVESELFLLISLVDMTITTLLLLEALA